MRREGRLPRDGTVVGGDDDAGPGADRRVVSGDFVGGSGVPAGQGLSRWGEGADGVGVQAPESEARWTG